MMRIALPESWPTTVEAAQAHEAEAIRAAAAARENGSAGADCSAGAAAAGVIGAAGERPPGWAEPGDAGPAGPAGPGGPADAGRRELRTVAGLDVAYDTASDVVVGAVVVLDVRSLAVVDQATAAGRAAFPYVPGLLAFREVPPLVEAWNRLAVEDAPDLLICDGYGVAHPRRFGLACHVGALTGLPTIGVAKTPFVGDYAVPDRHRGAWSPVVDRDEVVGRALRTQDGVREVFVSIGHGMDLETACRHVLTLSPRYRLPETTRAADQAARRALRAAAARIPADEVGSASQTQRR